MINRKPKKLVLSLICLAITSIRLMAFQNCPDFKEFDQKVAKAIEVLEAEEPKYRGDSTLLKAIANLRKLQGQRLTRANIVESWTSLSNMYGKKWEGAPTEVFEVQKIQGSDGMNRTDSDCIDLYNAQLKLSNSRINSEEQEEQKLPETSEKSPEEAVKTPPNSEKRKQPQTGQGTDLTIGSSIMKSDSNIEGSLDEVEDRLNDQEWLDGWGKWLLLIVPLVLLGFVVFSFLYMRSRMLKMRARMKRLDKSLIEEGFVEKVKENFEVLSKGLENITSKLNQLSSQPSAEPSYAGQFTLVQQQLQEIKDTLRVIEEENQFKKRVKETQEQKLPESLEPQVKEKKYAPAPYGMEFNPVLFQSTSDPDSVYKIEILEGQQRAYFSVLESPVNMERAILEHNDRLAGVCDYVKGRPSRESRVINVEKGVLKFTGSRWLVSQKAKIDFA